MNAINGLFAEARRRSSTSSGFNGSLVVVFSSGLSSLGDSAQDTIRSQVGYVAQMQDQMDTHKEGHIEENRAGGCRRIYVNVRKIGAYLLYLKIYILTNYKISSSSYKFVQISITIKYQLLLMNPMTRRL